MNFVQFIIAFLFIVLLGSLTVCGWYLITRGRWEYEPDGKRVAKGKIFKHFSLFFNRVHKNKRRIYYKGGFLQSMVNTIKSDLLIAMGIRETGIVTIKNDVVIVESKQAQGAPPPETNTALWNKMLNDYKIGVCRLDGDEGFRLFKEEPVNVFPDWVRDPISNCPTCFSSIYGSAFYWLSVMQLPALFAWSGQPLFTKLFFWAAYCFSMSVINTAISKKLS